MKITYVKNESEIAKIIGVLNLQFTAYKLLREGDDIKRIMDHGNSILRHMGLEGLTCQSYVSTEPFRSWIG